MSRRRGLPREILSLFLLAALLAPPLLALATRDEARCSCGMRAAACLCSLSAHRAGARCSLNGPSCRCAVRSPLPEGERTPAQGLGVLERPGLLAASFLLPEPKCAPLPRSGAVPLPTGPTATPELPPPRPLPFAA